MGESGALRVVGLLVVTHVSLNVHTGLPILPYHLAPSQGIPIKVTEFGSTVGINPAFNSEVVRHEVSRIPSNVVDRLGNVVMPCSGINLHGLWNSFE